MLNPAPRGDAAGETRLKPRARGPERARLMLQQLGPGFVKIGQFLSLRPDLIPPDYAQEFFKLLNQNPAFPWVEARAILEADIGPVGTAFAQIAPEPFAAGSLAQVHLARLHDGTEVAVKILRPGIAQQVERDICRARALARLAALFGFEFGVDPKTVIDEAGKWLRSEVDLRNELDNLIAMRELLGASPIQFLPKPFPQFCSARVLTVEFVFGVPLSEVIALLDQGGETALQARYPDIDPQRLAANLIEAVLHQMFRGTMFHADLHPGNLMAMEGDAVGFVDFGLCGALDENVASQQSRYIAAVYEGDTQRIGKTLLDFLIPGRGADPERFRAELASSSRSWRDRVQRPVEGTVRSADQTAVGSWMIDAIRAARNNGFTVPTGLLSAYRALLTAETVAARLSGRSQLAPVGRRFFASLQFDDVFQRLSPDELRAALPRIVRLLREAPERIGEALSDLASGRLRLQVENGESAQARQAANRRTLMVAIAIVSVGLALLAASPALAAIRLARPIAFAALAVCYLSIVWLWRKLR